jgi:excisionase family DNA binding protein
MASDRYWHLALTLSKGELARELGVSVRTIERMRKAGTLPACVPGVPRPRWARHAIEAWLAEGNGAGRVKA